MCDGFRNDMFGMEKMERNISYLLVASLIITAIQFTEAMKATVNMCEQTEVLGSNDIFIEYTGVSDGGSGTCMCNVTRAAGAPKIEIKTKGSTTLCGRMNCTERLLLQGPDVVPEYNSCTSNIGDTDEDCFTIANGETLLKDDDPLDDDDEQINITFSYSSQNDPLTQYFKLEIKVTGGGGSNINLYCSHHPDAPDEWPSTMFVESSPSTYTTVFMLHTDITRTDYTGTDSATMGVDQSTIGDGTSNPSINIGLVAGLSAGGAVVVVGIILLAVFMVKRRKEKPTTQSKLSETPRLNKPNGSVDGFGTELVDNTTYGNTDLKTVPSDTDLVDNFQYSVGTFKDPDFYTEATEIHDNPTYGSDPITPASIYTDDTQLVDNNMYIDISDKQPDPIQSNPITPTSVYTDDTQLLDNNTYTDISAKRPLGGPLYLDLHD